MIWWGWFVLGFSLLLVELFYPTGFIIFIVGMSAFPVGILQLMGLDLPEWFQWTLCGVLALTLSWVIRPRLIGWLGGRLKPTRELPGEEVVVNEPIAPGATGRGELRGATWRVRNAGTFALVAGEIYRVDSVDGITLVVTGSNKSS